MEISLTHKDVKLSRFYRTKVTVNLVDSGSAYHLACTNGQTELVHKEPLMSWEMKSADAFTMTRQRGFNPLVSTQNLIAKRHYELCQYSN